MGKYTNEAQKIQSIREDFPFLTSTNSRIAYLDNAASSQKPVQVIERMVELYKSEYANVHRGVYQLSESATAAYEGVRKKLSTFLNINASQSLIFTSGTTDAINLVAHSWGERFLSEGDEILLTQMEHHSNIVPWQLVAEKTGAKIKYIPIKGDCSLDMVAAETLFNSKTKILAINYVSNVLGVINPIDKLAQMARAHNAQILIDAAQAVPHLPVNLDKIDCDFFVFSSHKMLVDLPG